MVFSGSTQDWLTGSLIQELALKYNLAVVMPAGEKQFLLKRKRNRTWIRDIYSSRASGILPDIHLDCQIKPEDNFIGGLSRVDLEQFIQH